MLHTRLTAIYRLDLPIVSAGMGFIAIPSLAAAVSEAGGFGLLAPGPAPPQLLRDLIAATRRLTARPFGVNFIVENTAFGPLTQDGHIDVCVEEHIPVVVFFWTMPPSGWIRRLKGAGIRVWFQTGSIDDARKAVLAGIDAIICQGSEAGGHNSGTAGLFALLPAMVDTIPVPVVAAGGIADGRGVAAALALGAEGVCIGTRLVATHEAYAHDEYKRRIVAARETDIARTCIFGPEWPDAPMRVIRNRVVREFEPHSASTPPHPDPPESIGRTVIGGRRYIMPKFSAVLATPDTTGDFEEMCLAAGESAALVHDIRPAAHVVRDIMTQAEQIITGRLALLATAPVHR